MSTPYISHDIDARYVEPDVPQGRLILSLTESFAAKVAWGDEDSIVRLRNAVGLALPDVATSDDLPGYAQVER